MGLAKEVGLRTSRRVLLALDSTGAVDSMLHLQTDTTPSHGNALQACVASLLGLEMEAVPNFVAAPEGYWDAMLAHAATLGLSLLKVPLTLSLIHI